MKVLGAEAGCPAVGLSLVDTAEETQASITNQLHNVRPERAAKTQAHT